MVDLCFAFTLYTFYQTSFLHWKTAAFETSSRKQKSALQFIFPFRYFCISMVTFLKEKTHLK